MVGKYLISVLMAMLVLPLSPIMAQDTLAVISLNDFHGSFVKSGDIPGAGNIYSAISKIKKRYTGNVVVSAGDNFGGSYFSVLNKGRLLPFFFSRLGITYSAIGNHEFDNGQEFFAALGKDTIKYVCANIVNSESKKLLDNAVGSITTEIVLNDSDKVRLGIIGLISSGAKSQTKAENVKGLDFMDNYESLIKAESGKMDAKWKILLAHIGTSTDGSGKAQWDGAEIKDSLMKIRLDDVMGIASGHSHKYVCGRINDIPVVQGGISGMKIGVLRFIYDRKKRSVKPIEPLLVKVEDVVDHSSGRIEIDNAVDSTCNNTVVESINMKLSDVIGVATDDIIHDRNKNPRQLTMLGSLVCMAYADSYRRYKGLADESIVLGFCHFGCVRRSLSAGNVSVLTAGELLPFSNKLKVYRLKGKEIFRIIEEGIKNKKGCMQMNNLVVDTVYYNGKTRVLNVWYNIPGNKYIALNKNESYPVVVDEYITTGGDGYPTDIFPEEKWDKTISLEGTTDSFLLYLKGLYKKGIRLTTNSPYKARLKYYKHD